MRFNRCLIKASCYSLQSLKKKKKPGASLRVSQEVIPAVTHGVYYIY